MGSFGNYSRNWALKLPRFFFRNSSINYSQDTFGSFSSGIPHKIFPQEISPESFQEKFHGLHLKLRQGLLQEFFQGFHQSFLQGLVQIFFFKDSFISFFSSGFFGKCSRDSIINSYGYFLKKSSSDLLSNSSINSIENSRRNFFRYSFRKSCRKSYSDSFFIPFRY